jgi:hypothetical protein
VKRELQWEQWEDDTIARLYPVEGWRAVGRVLTHRTKGAITARANRNGVPGQPRYSRPRRAERKSGAFVLPWPKSDIDACRLLREWRGPVTPNLGLRP